ncbi:MAG: TRAP transporter small permease subunit, partial [Pseudomonadota bacterium]
MTRFTSRTSGLIGLASMVILSVYVLTVITNVFSRYLLDAPLPLLSDFGELLVPAALALVFPAAALSGKNLAIRFLGQYLG